MKKCPDDAARQPEKFDRFLMSGMVIQAAENIRSEEIRKATVVVLKNSEVYIDTPTGEDKSYDEYWSKVWRQDRKPKIQAQAKRIAASKMKDDGYVCIQSYKLARRCSGDRSFVCYDFPAAMIDIRPDEGIYERLRKSYVVDGKTIGY